MSIQLDEVVRVERCNDGIRVTLERRYTKTPPPELELYFISPKGAAMIGQFGDMVPPAKRNFCPECGARCQYCPECGEKLR